MFYWESEGVWRITDVPGGCLRSCGADLCQTRLSQLPESLTLRCQGPGCSPFWSSQGISLHSGAPLFPTELAGAPGFVEYFLPALFPGSIPHQALTFFTAVISKVNKCTRHPHDRYL